MSQFNNPDFADLLRTRLNERLVEESVDLERRKQWSAPSAAFLGGFTTVAGPAPVAKVSPYVSSPLPRTAREHLAAPERTALEAIENFLGRSLGPAFTRGELRHLVTGALKSSHPDHAGPAGVFPEIFAAYRRLKPRFT